MKNNIVDVVINVCGKPYQTTLALLSLLKYSGDYINKIFFIEENSGDKSHFNLAKHDYILNLIKDKVEYFRTPEALGLNPVDSNRLEEEDYRYSIRYQYGWEKTEADYLYIMHNDTEYFDDIIGKMVEGIGDKIAIGSVGQCWNCPAFAAGKCDSDSYFDYRPEFEELLELYENVEMPGTRKKRPYITRNNSSFFKNAPWPLPECRVNEWACLINMKIAKPITFPQGKVFPFGAYLKVNNTLMDIGSVWFRGVSLLGYRAKNMNIFKYMKHNVGHPSMSDAQRYLAEEFKALEILKKEYIHKEKF